MNSRCILSSLNAFIAIYLDRVNVFLKSNEPPNNVYEKFVLSSNSNTQFNSRTRYNLSGLNENISLFSKKEKKMERSTEYQWLRSKFIRGEFNHVAFRAYESAGNKRKVRTRLPLGIKSPKGTSAARTYKKRSAF